MTSLLPELDGIARPRWRPDVPALWRDATTIQLGDDVILGQVDAPHLRWLAGLDGLRTPDEIGRELPLPISQARRLLRALRAAAAIDDAARIPDAARWTTADGREVIDRRFAAALRTGRDLDAAYDAMRARDRVRVAVSSSGPLADLVAAAVESAGLRIVGRQSATVTVLAGRQHPDVPATLDDEESARPHLHVGMLTERATIGPLVVPGRTSCLRCHHLHRRDADPAWPLVAVQWEQAMRRIGDLAADPLLARLVADHVALVLRRFADDGVWSNLAWELRLPDGLGRIESRPPHPLCGCLWPT